MNKQHKHTCPLGEYDADEDSEEIMLINMIFSSSKRQKLSHLYLPRTVEDKILMEFDRRLLRMDKINFLKLTNILYSDLIRRKYQRVDIESGLQQPQLSPLQISYLGIRYMAGGRDLDLERSLNNNMVLPTSSLYYFIHIFLDAVMKNKELEINFNLTNPGVYVNGWRKKYHDSSFVDVVGCLDETEIIIKSTSTKTYNRKKFHSVKVVAVCDEQTRYHYVSLGVSGARHDSFAFKSSSLFHELNKIDLALNKNEVKMHDSSSQQNNLANMWKGKHIICDSAFCSSNIILKPFPKQSATKEQRKFNKQLRRRRVRVEHSFAQLKSTFAIFHTPIALSGYAYKLIMVAFQLHNFVMTSFVEANMNEKERKSLMTEEEKKIYKQELLKIKERREKR